GQIVWQWESDAFGSTVANEDPGNTGTKTTINLRFPGQYFDRESGLHYNMARYYDPQIGRYIQSDPIGLVGGINAFLYANANPLSFVDPEGLASCTYSITAHTMTCTPNSGGKSVTLGPSGVFSGVPGQCRNNSQCADNANEGPIPPGNYTINSDDRSGHEGFWRLEPNPQIPGWKCKTGLKRCGFMLHPGQVSLGCITVDPSNKNTMRQYNRIDRILQREDGSNTLTVTP
ncbi:MAG: Sel1 domain-containing protein, partial [Gammaproteobacteria bacterium]